MTCVRYALPRSIFNRLCDSMFAKYKKACKYLYLRRNKVSDKDIHCIRGFEDAAGPEYFLEIYRI